ncbi:MAG: cell division protein FtsA [Candidatus Krumholzibacteriia bacterium]
MFATRSLAQPGVILLDVGTHEVRALAAAFEGGRLQVRGAAMREFSAGRDGILVDLEAARAGLGEVLDAAARQSGLAIRRVVAGVGGTHVRCVRARGSLSLRIPVIVRESHLERILDAAADIGLPRDHEVLHVLPTGYRVDGARTVRAPLGMRARRLAAETAVVIVSRLALDNLERVLGEVGFELVDAAAEPLVAARAALTAEDRRCGAVLVDIGAENVGAAVYRDAVLQGLVCLGAGGAHVSRDLAYALRVDSVQAEALKRRLGVAQVASADRSRRVEVQHAGRPAYVSQTAVAHVIEPRMREILSLVRDALHAQHALSPADRVVLVGGGARLQGVDELAERVFGVPARVGEPVPQGDRGHAAPDRPSCAALGLVAFASWSGLGARRRRAPSWSAAVERLRRVLGAGARAGPGAAAARSARQLERSVHVTPRGGVDLEVRDVRVRTRV